MSNHSKSDAALAGAEQHFIDQVEEAWGRRATEDAQVALKTGLEHFPDSVPLLVRAGMLAMKNGNLEEAEAVLLRAVECEPDDWGALYQLGLYYIEQSDVYRAVQTHERLVELYPDDAGASNVLAYDYIIQGRPERALPMLERIVTESPDKQNYQINLARAQIGMGRFVEALGTLNRVTSQSPRSINSWCLIAEANFRLFRMSACAEAARQAFEIDPQNALARLWMYQVALEEGDVARASEHLNEALRIKPVFPQAYLEKGRLLWVAGQLPEAEQWFNIAYRTAPWDGRNIGMLAQFQRHGGGMTLFEEEPQALWRQWEQQARDAPYNFRLPWHLGARVFVDDQERAVSLLRLAVECGPDDIQALDDLGISLASREDYEGALNAFGRAVGLNDALPQTDEAMARIRGSYADTLVVQEQYEAAVIQYARVVPHLRNKPEDARTYYLYGVALAELERPDEAARIFEKALDLGLNEASIYRAHGMALRELGHPADAAESFKKAIALAPEDGVALYFLAESLAESGSIEAARPYAQAAKVNLPADDPDIDNLLERLGA